MTLYEKYEIERTKKRLDLQYEKDKLLAKTIGVTINDKEMFRRFIKNEDQGLFAFSIMCFLAGAALATIVVVLKYSVN